MTEIVEAAPLRLRWDPGLSIWLPVMVFTVLCLAAGDAYPWLAAYPADWVVPLPAWVDAWSDAGYWFHSTGVPRHLLAAQLADGGRAVHAALDPLADDDGAGRHDRIARRRDWSRRLRGRDARLPVDHRLLAPEHEHHGPRAPGDPDLRCFGFFIGALAFRVKRTRVIVDVALDVMQTMPAFAYLIPLLLLFGFGPVVGLIASAIYAIPFMVKNTMLGSRRRAERHRRVRRDERLYAVACGAGVGPKSGG